MSLPQAMTGRYFHLNQEALCRLMPTAQTGAQDPMTELRYGLRSPNYATRAATVKQFAELLPAVLVEENVFIDALNAMEDRDHPLLLVQAVNDAVSYLNFAVGDVYRTVDTDRMTQIAYFFNLLGKFVASGDSAEDRDDVVQDLSTRLMDAMTEVDDVKRELSAVRERRRCVEEEQRLIEEELQEDIALLTKENEALQKDRAQFLQVIADNDALIDVLAVESEELSAQLAAQEEAAKAESGLQMKTIDQLRGELEWSQKAVGTLSSAFGELGLEITESKKTNAALEAEVKDLKAKLKALL